MRKMTLLCAAVAQLSCVALASESPNPTVVFRDGKALLPIVVQVTGPLEFSLVGVVSSITRSLASAGIGVFVISTFDTDLILVKAVHLEAAVAVLQKAGHEVGQ